MFFLRSIRQRTVYGLNRSSVTTYGLLVYSSLSHRSFHHVIGLETKSWHQTAPHDVFFQSKNSGEILGDRSFYIVWSSPVGRKVHASYTKSFIKHRTEYYLLYAPCSILNSISSRIPYCFLYEPCSINTIPYYLLYEPCSILNSIWSRIPYTVPFLYELCSVPNDTMYKVPLWDVPGGVAQ